MLRSFVRVGFIHSAHHDVPREDCCHCEHVVLLMFVIIIMSSHVSPFRSSTMTQSITFAALLLGCKKIVVLRDPMDVVVSFYKFFSGWFFEPNSISLTDFSREFWLQRGVPASRMNNASYFVHLTSWYNTKRKDDEQVLIIFFEDLKEDLERQVRRVAKFISTDKVGLRSTCLREHERGQRIIVAHLALFSTHIHTQHDFTTDDCIQLATERASFQFMKEHGGQFDEKLSKRARNEACGLPQNAGIGTSSKINAGQSGSGAVALSDDLKSEIEAKWKEVVEPVTGCSTYEELRASFQKEN